MTKILGLPTAILELQLECVTVLLQHVASTHKITTTVRAAEQKGKALKTNSSLQCRCVSGNRRGILALSWMRCIKGLAAESVYKMRPGHPCLSTLKCAMRPSCSLVYIACKHTNTLVCYHSCNTAGGKKLAQVRCKAVLCS